MPDPARWLISCLAAFLCGSIPFGVMIARSRGLDIRNHGSKNVGATNVWRVLGWRAGLLCFALDALKGALPVALAGWWLGALGRREVSQEQAWGWMAVAASAAIGHMFSPWLGFKGGKGVAAGLGALLAMWPQVTWAALGALAVFAVVAFVTRYVGISSCLAALSLPLWTIAARWAGVIGEGAKPAERMRHGWSFVAALALLAALVIWRHRGNIARTLAGTENRIGKRTPVTTPHP